KTATAAKPTPYTSPTSSGCRGARTASTGYLTTGPTHARQHTAPPGVLRDAWRGLSSYLKHLLLLLLAGGGTCHLGGCIVPRQPCGYVPLWRLPELLGFLGCPLVLVDLRSR